MKTTSNLIVLLAGFSLPFLFGNTSTIKSVLPHSDSTYILERNLDSVNNKILLVDEFTKKTLKNNNKILQNTKEEFLRVDLCISNACSKIVMADSQNINCDTVKDLE